MEFNKQKLRTEEPLPEGLAWEDMKVGILEGLEQEPTSQKRTLRVWKRLGLASTALLLLLFTCTHYTTNTPESAEPKAVQQSAAIAGDRISDIELPVTENATQGEKIAMMKATTNRLQNKAESFDKLENTAVKMIDNQRNELSRLHVDLSETIASADFEKPVELREMTPVNTLQSETSSLTIVEEKPSFPFVQGEKVPEFFHRFALEASLGLSTWQSQYDESTPESIARASTETAIPSYQATFAFKYHLRPKFFVGTGLQFQQLESRFDFEHQQNIEIENRTTLVGIRVNAINNDSTFIFENHADAIETRSVRHFNQHRLWNLPLTLGCSIQRNRLSFEVSGGALLSVHARSQGRTLNDSVIIDYDQSEPIHHNNYGIAALAKAQINYALSDKLYVGGAVANAFWLKNWSTQTGISMQPNTTSFSLVLGQRF